MVEKGLSGSVEGRVSRQLPKEELEALRDAPDKTSKGKIVHRLINNFPSYVIHADPDMLVLNKPAGIDSQGGLGTGIDIIDVCRFILNEPISPVHRLDRNTSGILVFGRSSMARRLLGIQFQHKSDSGISKQYSALLTGKIEGTGTFPVNILLDQSKDKVEVVEPPKEGKEAHSFFTPVVVFDRTERVATLTEVKILTGRKHQIRVSAAYIGHPVVGDKLYNPDPSGAPRQLLHAQRLNLFHPTTGEELLFEAPLPTDFLKVLSKL